MGFNSAFKGLSVSDVLLGNYITPYLWGDIKFICGYLRENKFLLILGLLHWYSESKLISSSENSVSKTARTNSWSVNRVGWCNSKAVVELYEGAIRIEHRLSYGLVSLKLFLKLPNILKANVDS